MWHKKPDLFPIISIPIPFQFAIETPDVLAMMSQKNYMLHLSGQKRGMTKLKYIWLVILTGKCLKVISSPEH